MFIPTKSTLGFDTAPVPVNVEWSYVMLPFLISTVPDSALITGVVSVVLASVFESVFPLRSKVMLFLSSRVASSVTSCINVTVSPGLTAAMASAKVA
ncbi:MAG: hypothetical protein IJQ00_10680 [Kiritimatiellae bacterium]|nr:hypothetical protein [Kiritimatiellia bacterium]